jgi:hypothetical protein
MGEDGRYVGLSLHRAARISSAARGGQVLLSSTTAGLVSDNLPPSVLLRDFGRHTLKDVDRPERVSQLVIDGLPSVFPRVRTEGDRRRRLRVIVVAALLLAVGGIAAGVVLATRDESRPVAVVPNSVAAIDPHTNRIVADIGTGQRPTAVAVGEGGVWVLNADDRTVQEIDPARQAVARTTGVPESVSSATSSGLAYPPVFAVGEGAVWVGQDTTLLKLDPTHNLPGQSVPVPGTDRAKAGPLAPGATSPGARLRGVAIGAGSIWLARDDSKVFRLDPSRGKAVAPSIDVPVGSLAGLIPIMAFGNDALWLTDASDPGLVRVDPETNAAVATFRAFRPMSTGLPWGVDRCGRTHQPASTGLMPTGAA